MSVQGEFEKRCYVVGAPTELSFVTSSLSMIFTFTSTPGNLLIILAVVLNPNKNLRTPFNWLLVNLATADLIVGTITNPISVYVHMKEGLKEKIPVDDVRAIHMSYFISCTASVLSLSSLAVERYLAVRKPNTYRTNVTNKRIALTVAAVWLISLALPNIYFKVGYTTYAFIFANTAIAVAIAITCVTYSLMLRKFRERSHDISNSTANAREARYTISPSADPSRNKNLSTNATNTNTPNSVLTSAREMEVKVTKIFIVILIAMLCCYGPSTVLIYVMNFCKSCSCTTLHWFRDLQFIFVLMNSSVNFLCYGLRSPRFRSAFTKILKIKRRNNRAEESCISSINSAPTPSFTSNATTTRVEEIQQSEIEIQMGQLGTTNKALAVAIA